ncbi:Manganese/iron superoxide dismutase [Melampsora americana]|nr:Manganese/iron superoxide dismutase [Melampsora americana]
MFNSGIAKLFSLALLLRALNLTGATPVAPRSLVGQQNVTLPPLTYAYNALEPVISTQIMTLHHSRHHQAFVTGLNNALASYSAAVQSGDLPKQIEIQGLIKFNGGGHINHSLYWKNLQPVNLGGGKMKPGVFADAVQAQFGGLNGLKTKMNSVGSTFQGSGWLWLAREKNGKKLSIVTTVNQDPLVGPLIPIIGIDMWEHSWYLQHFNVRATYLTDIWKVINFDEAERRFKAM